MTSVKTGRRRASKSSRRTNKHMSRLAIVGIAGLVAVATLIAAQAFGGGSGDIPARVATGDGRVLGRADAPVTVIEYADFQCPVCKRAETAVISEIEREYVESGLVNIEFRMFPFLGQESWDAAQAAEAAREQGKFWEYHDALFNAQGRENGGTFSYERLVEIARNLGLDVPRFEATLTSNQYLDAIQREVDGARDRGVSSTPTFFIGEEKIVGAKAYSVFQEVIEQELKAVGVEAGAR